MVLKEGNRLIIFDFDGTLTDNRVLVFQDGTEAVFCNRSDGLGFGMLKKKNIHTLIMSTEKNPVVMQRANKLQTEVLQGVEDKGVTLKKYCMENNYSLSDVVYVGNDLNDLSAMSIVGTAIAVADSHPKVLALAHHVLHKKGGEGIVLEVIDWLEANK